MDDRDPAKRSRRVIAVALLGLATALGVLAYHYADDLIDLVQSVVTGKAGPAHGHIRY